MGSCKSHSLEYTGLTSTLFYKQRFYKQHKVEIAKKKLSKSQATP